MRSSWAAVATALNGAGYRTLAPDQRGYSPGARPAGRRDYTLDRLAGDVLTLADAAHATRFDVVGHDWGAALAWYLAGHHPEQQPAYKAAGMCRLLCNEFRTAQLFAIRAAR